MSSSVFPVALSKFLIAGTEPIPIRLGSTPATLCPTKRASDFKPSVVTASSLANCELIKSERTDMKINIKVLSAKKGNLYRCRASCN